MPIRSLYDARVRDGTIERDAAQERVVERLDALCDAVDGYSPARKTSALGWLFGAKASAGAPKGLYLWGGVGRGKSMLMDMFFERADVGKKRRVHFHAFMAEVHADIFRWRQAAKRGEVKGEDPIEPVADAIARTCALLCFDEFTVTDIADAMILGRLFKVLLASGVVIVATSNVAPSDLYRDGLNRQLFLPSIELITTHMDVLELSSRADFRTNLTVYTRPSSFFRARMASPPCHGAGSALTNSKWFASTAGTFLRFGGCGSGEEVGQLHASTREKPPGKGAKHLDWTTCLREGF